MNVVLHVAGYALLCAFLYILVSTVPRWDLGLVAGATLLLAFWDLFVHDRVRQRRARQGRS